MEKIIEEIKNFLESDSLRMQLNYETTEYEGQVKRVVKIIIDKKEEIKDQDQDEDEKEIEEILDKLGVSTCRGYLYLRDAIKIISSYKVIKNDKINLSKDVFDKVAEKYKANYKSVDIAIRRTIDEAWYLGKIQKTIFGEIYKEKPKAKEFLLKVANMIRNKNFL